MGFRRARLDSLAESPFPSSPPCPAPLSPMPRGSAACLLARPRSVRTPGGASTVGNPPSNGRVSRSLATPVGEDRSLGKHTPSRPGALYACGRRTTPPPRGGMHGGRVSKGPFFGRALISAWSRRRRGVVAGPEACRPWGPAHSWPRSHPVSLAKIPRGDAAGASAPLPRRCSSRCRGGRGRCLGSPSYPRGRRLGSSGRACKRRRLPIAEALVLSGERRELPQRALWVHFHLGTGVPQGEHTLPPSPSPPRGVSMRYGCGTSGVAWGRAWSD